MHEATDNSPSLFSVASSASVISVSSRLDQNVRTR